MIAAQSPSAPGTCPAERAGAPYRELFVTRQATGCHRMDIVSTEHEDSEGSDHNCTMPKASVEEEGVHHGHPGASG